MPVQEPTPPRLAARQAVHPREFVREVFVGVSNKAAVLRAVTGDYLRRAGVDIKLDHGVGDLAFASARASAVLQNNAPIAAEGA
jgi:LysR family hca operon transcriptional activator